MTEETTPDTARLRETLAAEFGPEVAADFEAMLDAVGNLRANANANDIDEVAISLLAGANNEVLYYDIKRWGADVGLASESTFSVNKLRLEEVDVLDTEPVADGVGRPRQRLLLDGDRLRRADAADVVRTLREATSEPADERGGGERAPGNDGGRAPGKNEGEGETSTEMRLEAANRVSNLVFRAAAPAIIEVAHFHDGIRYSELADHLETDSPSTISTRLRELEEAGVIDRQVYDEIPPKVVYSLTESGEELYERLCPFFEFFQETGR